MLENWVLRKIFGPKVYEVTGKWRKPHGEELNDLYLLAKYFSGYHIKKNGNGLDM
jgi:hypothetical protein